MNLVDIVLGLGLLWSTLRGWRIGLVRSVIGLLGLFLAYGLALVYGRDAAAWLVGGSPDGHTAAALLGFLSVFLLVLAACAIGGRIVRGVLHLSQPDWARGCWSLGFSPSCSGPIPCTVDCRSRSTTPPSDRRSSTRRWF